MAGAAACASRLESTWIALACGMSDGLAVGAHAERAIAQRALQTRCDAHWGTFRVVTTCLGRPIVRWSQYIVSLQVGTLARDVI